MKRLTSIGVTQEATIHPVEIRDRLLALRKEAEQKVLERLSDFVHIDCPACASPRGELGFEKRGYNFRQCSDCRTLYLSPRPLQEMLAAYYFESEYGRYLESEEYLHAVRDFRQRESERRADRLVMLSEKVPDSNDRFLNYAAKSMLLSEALNRLGQSKSYDLPAPWARSTNALDCDGMDVISAFDIVERLPCPERELRLLVSLLRPEGRIIFAMRSGSGFDLLSLWHHLDLFPVEHMNLITVEGIDILLQRVGLGVTEVSTPGQLDLQFVERIRSEHNLSINRFIDYLIDKRDDFAKNEFQQFLQRGLLSSHMVIVGVKRA